MMSHDVIQDALFSTARPLMAAAPNPTPGVAAQVLQREGLGTTQDLGQIDFTIDGGRSHFS